ncbi:hypothetical protein [Amycolatopsis sp. DG1A-15b]|uniref:hypothetical protein n=1 Tax=Amycolatopsis sp. DG1A-15b TaxID=3052846 RepID=UPI00255BDBF8|nr:hypothetical protein [Amycolatopsis sp. DG1A-15b]WIX85869.1 hypothetical protein QRY02_32285 [Amycolatopsis sp. DG1A-15b]
MPPQRPAPGRHLDSERGYLEVAGREADRPLREQFLGFRDLETADMDWADIRKRRFRRRASIVRVSASCSPRCRRWCDKMDYYIVATPAAELSRERLQEFFDRHQGTWADASRQWVEFRKLGRPPRPEIRTSTDSFHRPRRSAKV